MCVLLLHRIFHLFLPQPQIFSPSSNSFKSLQIYIQKLRKLSTILGGSWLSLSPLHRLIFRPHIISAGNTRTVVVSAATIRNTRRRLSLTRKFFEKASEKDDETLSFNPFGFVTDNPSSRSAIQLPEVPAEDENVGYMLYVVKWLVADYEVAKVMFRFRPTSVTESDLRKLKSNI